MENGSIVWNRTYNINQGNNMFDGVRTTIVGSDGYIYGSGFWEVMNQTQFLWCMEEVQW